MRHVRVCKSNECETVTVTLATDGYTGGCQIGKLALLPRALLPRADNAQSRASPIGNALGSRVPAFPNR